MQLVKAYIAHQSRGRIRLRMPERRNHHNSFIAWQNSIEQWPQTQLVEINPATASLLVHHEGSSDSLLEQVNKLGLEIVSQQLVPVKAETGAELVEQPKQVQSLPVWKAVTDQLELVNKKLSQLTGGSIDLPSLLFIALLLQGLIQFIRRPALIMPWDTAWWFALNVYMMVRQQGE